MEKKYVILISVLVILGLCFLGLWSGATSLESVAKERAAKTGFQNAKREEGALLESVRKEFPRDWGVTSSAGEPSVDHLKKGAFECSRSRRFVFSQPVSPDDLLAMKTKLESLPALKKWADQAEGKKEQRTYQFVIAPPAEGKAVLEATLTAASALK